jgi:hypothetical protein
MKTWAINVLRVNLKPDSLLLFRTLLYLWFMLYLLWNMPVSEAIWGRNSLVMPVVASPEPINNIFYFLSYNGVLAWMVLWVHGLSLLLAIAGVAGIIPRILVYLTAGMMYFGGYLSFNSGYVLMWLMSFYMIAANPRSNKPLAIVANNFVLAAGIAQLLLVYGMAAAYKMIGHSWLDGSAMHYTLALPHFDRLGIGEWLCEHSWLSAGMNYTALAYQTFFPIMVWIRRIRKYWLMAGIGFHGFIMLAMGLWDFGLAMIFCYALLLPNHQAAWLLKKLKIRSYGYNGRLEKTGY